MYNKFLKTLTGEEVNSVLGLHSSLVKDQGNRIKNLEKIQVANFQMIAFRRLYSKIKNALKTMIDNQALTF